MFLKDGSFLVKLVYKYLLICVRQESNPDFSVHVIYNKQIRKKKICLTDIQHLPMQLSFIMHYKCMFKSRQLLNFKINNKQSLCFLFQH